MKVSAFIAQRLRERWQEGDLREAQAALWQDPEFRAHMTEQKREQMQEQWQDPAFRAHMEQVLKDRWKDAQRVERVRRAMQGEQKAGERKSTYSTNSSSGATHPRDAQRDFIAEQ
jgi:hypothetical protein